MKSICVFCGSSIGNRAEYLEEAGRFGKALAGRNIRLVYGGANVGMMGMVARTCLENGGEVIGIMPEKLVENEVANEELSELIIVDSMHERKAMMSELSDGFISLPGGIGTLEETFEVFTLLQLGIQLKSIGLLNVNGYFDRLLGFLKHMVDEGFLHSIHTDMLLVEKDVEILIKKMLESKPVKADKWFDRDKNLI